MSLIESEYRAPWWLPGGHLQTIVPAEFMPSPKVDYRREIWDTPDGDIIAVDFSTPEPADIAAPVMVHFHGLEGSSQSHYARKLMAKCAAEGVRGMVVHYRGCGGINNRKPRAYFAGDACELDWIFARVKERYPLSRIYSMAVSLGANNLLFWAGTRGSKAASYVDRMVAVCSPLDLVRSSEVISKGFSRVYELNFVITLKQKALQKAKEYPELFDAERIRKVKRLNEYDNVVTAPMHGFKNALDYWTKCSSLPVLSSVTIPTLVLNARNDPIVGYEILPKVCDVAACMTLEYPDTGGHCGFPQRKYEGSFGYLSKRTFDFCFNGR